MIRRIEARGDLYTATHEGWYCSPCETFYTEKELRRGQDLPRPRHAGRVEVGGERLLPPVASTSSRSSTGTTRDPEAVRPATRLNEVRSFVESGLRDLSVSRANLEWGIPFPGHPGQTVYVWLDALTNYISALGFGRGGRRPLPDASGRTGDVRLHLIGKDILRFHAVYWPAFLMSAGLPLPTTVWAHGWWQRDGRKMSKSAGNVVRPDDLIDRFGADSRALLPAARDGLRPGRRASRTRRFVDRYNSDLANDLGNTVSRLVTLSRRAFDGKTPPVPCGDNPLSRRRAGRCRSTARPWRSWPSTAPWRRSGGCSPRPTSTS